MGFSNYKITDKPSDTTKSNLIYITYTKYENDWPSFMHTHPFTELFLVTGGVGEFYVENNIYPLKKGDFILVNPDLRHFKIKYNSINRRNAVFFCQIS